MKIEIDTVNKTVKVKDATIWSLMEFMQQKFDDWKEYKIIEEPVFIYKYDS